MSRENRRRKTSSFPGLFSKRSGGRPTAPANGASAKPPVAGNKKPLLNISLPKGPPQKQASVSYLLLFVLLCVAVTGGMIYHLHLRFEGVRLGYETSRVRAERAQLVAEQRELSLELSSLKSPERVEAEAREKLGMEMPELDQIVPMEKRLSPVLASGRAR